MGKKKTATKKTTVKKTPTAADIERFHNLAWAISIAVQDSAADADKLVELVHNVLECYKKQCLRPGKGVKAGNGDKQEQEMET